MLVCLYLLVLVDTCWSAPAIRMSKWCFKDLVLGLDDIIIYYTIVNLLYYTIIYHNIISHINI